MGLFVCLLGFQGAATTMVIMRPCEAETDSRWITFALNPRPDNDFFMQIARRPGNHKQSQNIPEHIRRRTESPIIMA